MNKYELMTIYPTEDEKFKAGTEAVRSILAQFGASVEKEEDYNTRDLTYEVKKQTRGHFVLFTINANPAKLVEINAQFKLVKDLLKSLFVKIDSKN